MKFIINTFFFLLFPLSLFSQTNKVLELEVLKLENQNGTNISFFQKGEKKVFQAFFNANKYDSANLEISAFSDSWLFVNQKLLTKIEKETVFIFHSKEKIKEYGTGNFSFTFFSETNQKPIIKLVTNKSALAKTSLSAAPNFAKKIINYGNHEIVFSSILLIAFLLYLKVVNIPFGLSFLGASAMNIVQGLGLGEKKTIIENIAFLLFYTIFLVFLFSVFFTDFVGNKEISYITGFACFGIFFGTLLFRFLLIKMITSVFYSKKLFEAHNAEFINVTHFFLLILVPLVLLLTIVESFLSIESVAFFLIGIILIKSIIIIFRVNKSITLKKTYLFAYFCTSELLPTIVTIKLLSVI